MVQYARLKTTYHFDAAHFLPNYDGPCHEMHGHRWELDVIIEGRVNSETGMVGDFKVLKHLINRLVIDHMDHTTLNEIIPNPTAENICEHLWRQLDRNLHFKLIELRLRETPECEVIYRGGVN